MAEKFAHTVARAVSSRPWAFLLDCPPRAHHRRNLPLSWADGNILFGWEPVSSIELREGACRGRPFEKMRAFLDPGAGAAISVGYLSYDLGGLIEPKAASGHPADPMPLAGFALYERFFEIDPSTGALWVVKNGRRRPARGDDFDEIRRLAADAAPAGEGDPADEIRADFVPEAYIEAVRTAREYILSGDIFEVNLSQRFTARWALPAWELYLRLRNLNPAPFAAFLNLPGGTILSSSPELFLHRNGDLVVTRPIKGTAARSELPAEDDRAAARLAASEKDNAELAMIIDLERNDLGRVCRYGSVAVRERARVETFARVHHLVSTVEGRLAEGVDLAGLLSAAFPGGSITGAPKVRAMQIIDELEPLRRGVYTGSIGCVLPGERAEFNIAIRTMIMRAGRVALQVGGAVTADSDPRAEYEETLAKALGMLEALGIEGRFVGGGQRV